METIKLTQFSKGSGCGCKIAPAMLENILHSKTIDPQFNNLIVGNKNNEDAAVYDLQNGDYLISTTDFFTPIVDDPKTFGKVASANALSDVYAMGGKPILATGILGWPIDKIDPLFAKEVIEGAKRICHLANIPLAGGHSIDSPEPFFGLAVNGLVNSTHLKLNSTLNKGDLLYITKKIGVGILSAAQKRGELLDEHKGVAEKIMLQLNAIGEKLGVLPYVTALTDITGFGLAGHLLEMLKPNNLKAELYYHKIPFINNLRAYTSIMCIPDNTYRNWNAYEKYIEGVTSESLMTICDPQTSGGLLIGVDKDHKEDFEQFLKENNYTEFTEPIGTIGSAITEKLIKIRYES